EGEDALLEGLAAAGQQAGSQVAGAATTDALGVPALALSRASFGAERERSLLGGSGPQGKAGRQPASRARGQLKEGHFAHHRRLFLVEPTSEERWRRPDGNAEMAQAGRQDARGAPLFQIRATPQHARSCRELAALQMLHDVGEIQEFLMERPFCVEALLILADVCRGAGEHQQAFSLTRRAVYAVECGFGAGFSPLAPAGEPPWPCVRLELPATAEPGWPGWPWLWALWEYMMALASQGLHRTATEVGKLLIAMTLPRDPMHVLIHLDFFCLRSGQHRALLALADGLLAPCVDLPSGGGGGGARGLGCSLPNFAYSAALAVRHLSPSDSGEEALRLLEVAHVLGPLAAEPRAAAAGPAEEGPGANGPHARLARAMLLFPQVLRPLLDALGVNVEAPPPSSTSRRTWSDILGHPPFVRAGQMTRHSRHFLALALLGDACARRFAPLWRDSALQQWLYACASRLSQMAESSLFDSEFRAAQDAWSTADLGIDDALSNDYGDFSGSEVDQNRAVPGAIRRALETGFGLAGAEDEHRALYAVAAAPAAGDPPGGEAELLAALRASELAEEARQRRLLVEEQDRELQESLAADRARDAGAATAEETSLRQLLDMGFPEAAAQVALAAARGDVSAAAAALIG
ncbi:unnamed protein product, partial [Prorocentrum cordatum]